MKFNEIEARLEVVTNCILGDILADFDDPEEGDFDYENATLDELALNLSDMVEAHILDSDEMLEFHEGTGWEETEDADNDADNVVGVPFSPLADPFRCCDHEHEPHFCTHEEEVDGVFVQCACEGM